MKKTIMSFTLAAVLATSALGVSAAVVDYEPTPDGKYTGVTYNVGTANASEYYGVVVMKGTDSAVDFSNTDNILYIDQVTADANGNITLNDFATKGVAPGEQGFEEGAIYIGGAGLDTATLIGYTKDAKEPLTPKYTISGTVTDDSSSKEAAVKLYNSAQELVAETTTVGGAYTLADIPEGTGYSLVISKPGFAAYKFINIALNAAKVLDADMTALVGDVNADGVIGYDDLMSLLSDYDKTSATATVPETDLNGDGTIGYDDLMLLLGKYDNVSIEIDASL